jgi:hypothetical protein
MTAWLTRVLAELARIVRAGGRIVVLAPEIRASAIPSTLAVRSRDPLRLLGTKTTLWVFDRTGVTHGRPAMRSTIASAAPAAPFTRS